MKEPNPLLLLRVGVIDDAMLNSNELVVAILMSTFWFGTCLAFIIKKKNIFYPKVRGSFAVLQGYLGLISGLIFLMVFIF